MMGHYIDPSHSIVIPFLAQSYYTKTVQKVMWTVSIAAPEFHDLAVLDTEYISTNGNNRDCCYIHVAVYYSPRI